MNMSIPVGSDSENVFATCCHKPNGKDSFYLSANTLIYVASGEFNLLINDKSVATVSTGECIFLRKDHHITLISNYINELGYNLAIFLFFPRQTLFDYYKTLYKWDLPKSVERSKKSFIIIPRSSLLKSLFDSFKPYWERGEHPEKHWLRIKVLEAIRLLLNLDESMFESLFDFSSQWKLDIMDFLEQNYKYDLTIEDIAKYTGRSVSTFKRDFCLLTELSPHDWIIKRRLHEARRLIKTTDWSIYKIMQNVGFKNFSHFSKRYHKLFNETPTESRQHDNIK